MEKKNGSQTIVNDFLKDLQHTQSFSHKLYLGFFVCLWRVNSRDLFCMYIPSHREACQQTSSVFLAKDVVKAATTRRKWWAGTGNHHFSSILTH